MIERKVLAAALLPLVMGCVADRRGSDGPAQVVAATGTGEVARDTYALGTSLTPEGAVPRDAEVDRVTPGGEVFLSVYVAGASVDQTIEVEWVDPQGQVIRRDRAEVPKVAQYAPFTSGETRAWQQGEHRVVVTINGRRVGERPFEVL